MSCTRFPRTTRTLAALLAGLLLAIVAVPLIAQSADDSTPRHPLPGYDKAHEITLTGTVQQMTSHAPAGAPAGVHVLVAGPQGTVDAHLGPYLSHDTLQALQTGIPVQIVGAVETFQGRSYLLARQVIFSGRTVTVRSANGFLLQGQPGSAGHHRNANAKTSQAEVSGGAR